MQISTLEIIEVGNNQPLANIQIPNGEGLTRFLHLPFTWLDKITPVTFLLENEPDPNVIGFSVFSSRPQPTRMRASDQRQEAGLKLSREPLFFEHDLSIKRKNRIFSLVNSGCLGGFMVSSGDVQISLQAEIHIEKNKATKQDNSSEIYSKLVASLAPSEI